MKATALHHRSPKRAAAQELYRDALLVVNARDRGECQAQGLVPSVKCSGPRDPHHIAGRNGERLYDPDQIVTLCRAHHSWVHAQTRQARTFGLLR